MKKVVYILFGLSLVMLCALACEEIPPDISPPGGGGGTAPNTSELQDQPRQAIIEEFTGVQCVNCPAGSAQIESMLGDFGGQLIAVSIHSGFFSDPFPDSNFDFRTSDGDAILDYVGQPLGFPTAVVDRTIFDGENELQVFQASWNGHVTTRLAEDPKIRIGIDASFDDASRAISVDLTFLPAEILDNTNLRYTVMLTENDIADYQLTPDGTVSDYKHKHVFRDVLTSNFDGDPIEEEIFPNISFTKSLSYTLPNNWKEDDCSIIAFVNFSSGDTKEILQAAEVHLIE